MALNIRNLFFPRGLNCPLCGAELIKEEQGVCAHCAPKLPAPPGETPAPEGLLFLRSAFCYEEPVRTLIHHFKYDYQRHLACFFARRLLPLLPAEKDWLLCPVPSHPLRRKERGFSQTLELARELSGLCSLGLCPPKALVRVRNTPSQTLLNACQRAENLKDAFLADPALVGGRKILLIDDVSTTGATLLECAAALKKAGAAQIAALTVAR